MNVNGFVLVAVIGTLLVGSAPAQENPVKPAGTVQLDLSKLPPELAKRVLAEIAAGKAAAAPNKVDPANERNLIARDKAKAAGANREDAEDADDDKKPANPNKRKRSEKASEREKEEKEKEKEREKKIEELKKKPGEPAKPKGPEKKERDD